MSAENIHRTAANMFPSKEDWTALQGGEPQVYYDPKNPQGKAWRVIHIYDGDSGTDFTNGRILPTMPPKGNRVEFSDISLAGDDRNESRTIRVPSMMVHALHGGPCGERSGNFTSSDYDRIKNEDEHHRLLRQMAQAGFWELKYTLVDGDKPMLVPRPIDVNRNHPNS